MAATITALGRASADRSVVILATMKELGSKSAEFHIGIKAHLDAVGAGYALLVGEEMAPLAETLARDIAWAGKFTHCASAKDAVVTAQDIILPGDAVLMGLSAVVDALVGAVKG
jgi:UDP-N-acetylmuramoyl-tripeptide--D-alanyl-D-alanine ligase